MSLQNSFQQRNLIFDLTCQNKQKAITALVNCINDNYHICSTPQTLVSEFMKREQKGSTGLQNGIAVPHIKVDYLKESYLAIGIHHKGMDFQSLDGKPTHIIFLILAPLSGTQEHLRFLSTMSRVFLQKNYKDRILQEKTSEGVCQIFQEIFCG